MPIDDYIHRLCDKIGDIEWWNSPSNPDIFPDIAIYYAEDGLYLVRYCFGAFPTYSFILANSFFDAEIQALDCYLRYIFGGIREIMK
jgi:hypothetical protein